jgi:hypothetical protein
MTISEIQLYNALNDFIDREIIPLASNMDKTKQFLFGLKIGVVKYSMRDAIKDYLSKPEMKVLELVDDNGNVAIDPIYQSALDAIRKVQKFELGGITFKENDLQNLYSIIQNYAN